MPQTVTQSGTTKVTYGWFADGSKYSVQDAQGNGYCYIGSLIYSSTTGTTAQESTDFSGGRIVLSGNTQTIHYHHKDHLGSVRAITDGSGSTIEQNAYYPFGGRHTFGQTYAQTTTNRYKFNGKEHQTIGTLDLLDYGARMYDTKIGRWLVQDPLAEKYYPFSAYNYCVNNPVMFVDPDGKKIMIGDKDVPSVLKDGTEYEKKVLDDLIILMKSDYRIASVIEDLNKSKYVIRICSPTEKPADKNGEKNNLNAFIPFNPESQKYIPERGVRTGGIIYYDPNNYTTARGETRDPIIGLAHEIGHADNAIKGRRVVYNQDNAEKGISKKDVELGNKNEELSIDLENILRGVGNHFR